MVLALGCSDIRLSKVLQHSQANGNATAVSRQILGLEMGFHLLGSETQGGQGIEIVEYFMGKTSTVVTDG